MTGSEENKIITDNKMREKVKREPEAIRNFFEYLCNSGRDSAQTRKVFVNTTIRFSDWVMEQLDIDLYSKKNWKKITPEIINRYLLEAGKNIKPKTKADYHVALNKFFRKFGIHTSTTALSPLAIDAFPISSEMPWRSPVCS